MKEEKKLPRLDFYRSEKLYRITAWGPCKECLTWAGDLTLEATKKYLREEGYETFSIREISEYKEPKDFRPEHLKRMGVTMSKGGKDG